MRTLIINMGRGLLVFAVLVVPSYLLIVLFPELSKTIGVILLAIPYLAVFLSGAAISHYSNSDKLSIPCAFGIVAAIFLGFINYCGSAIGFPSDLPGFKSSLWIIALSSPAMIFLSAIGAVSMNMFQKLNNKS